MIVLDGFEPFGRWFCFKRLDQSAGPPGFFNLLIPGSGSVNPFDHVMIYRFRIPSSYRKFSRIFAGFIVLFPLDFSIGYVLFPFPALESKAWLNISIEQDIFSILSKKERPSAAKRTAPARSDPIRFMLYRYNKVEFISKISITPADKSDCEAGSP